LGDQCEMFGITDPGMVRSSNQDCIHVDAQHGLFVLADGVGGGPSGELASRIAVQTVRDALREELESRWYRFWGRADSARLAVMEQAVMAAHEAVRQQIEEDPDLKGMASTLLVGVLEPGRCLCVAVGDSRLYHLNADRLRQITHDQTLANKLCDDGFITPDDAQYARYTHILVHAVGGEELPVVQRHVLEMNTGDRVLACSDGLSGMLPDAAINDLLMQAQRLDEAGNSLVAAANEAGGKDNVSVVVATVGARGLLPLCG